MSNEEFKLGGALANTIKDTSTHMQKGPTPFGMSQAETRRV